MTGRVVAIAALGPDGEPSCEEDRYNDRLELLLSTTPLRETLPCMYLKEGAA